jgi:hypothetical protein
LFTIENRDTETLGIRNLFEEYLRSASLLPVRFESLHDIPLDDIVPEDDADPFTCGPILRKAERFGDAPFTLLIRVVDVREAEILSVAQEAEKLPRVVPSRDDENVVYSRVDQGLDRVEDHRLVVYGKKMLVRHLREGIQASTESAGKNDTLHREPLLVSRYTAVNPDSIAESY